jgi:hypothetical protein
MGGAIATVDLKQFRRALGFAAFGEARLTKVGPADPVVFTSETDPDAYALVMPMRV